MMCHAKAASRRCSSVTARMKSRILDSELADVLPIGEEQRELQKQGEIKNVI
jgi:hypothetical protein